MLPVIIITALWKSNKRDQETSFTRLRYCWSTLIIQNTIQANTHV